MQSHLVDNKSGHAGNGGAIFIFADHDIHVIKPFCQLASSRPFILIR